MQHRKMVIMGQEKNLKSKDESDVPGYVSCSSRFQYSAATGAAVTEPMKIHVKHMPSSMLLVVSGSWHPT